MSITQNLKKRFPKIREGEPLKNHCTFRVGGPADFFYELTNIEEIPELVTFAEENTIPYRIIGRGTNILFTDKGFRGLIIKNLTKGFRVSENEIIADSGVLLSQIIRLSIDHRLSGLEPLYGLPGTIGGAVWGNAGIPNVETGSFVKQVTLFNVSDGVRDVSGENIEFRYRNTSLQHSGDIIMRVILKLKKGAEEQSKELIKKIDEIRRGKQPIGFTAGSFFKNPNKVAPFGRVNEVASLRLGLLDKSAGYLIDQAGLKGKCIGDAEISQKHANFFMNRGNATFAEIFELAKLAQKEVKRRFDINLEMEVKIIGDL